MGMSRPYRVSPCKIEKREGGSKMDMVTVAMVTCEYACKRGRERDVTANVRVICKCASKMGRGFGCDSYT